MADLRKRLMEMLAEEPETDENELLDSEETPPETGDNTDVEATDGNDETGDGADYPSDETPSESTIEPSTVENTEVVAPKLDKDVTIITSEDMVEESLDMRLATFYTKQEELENTVKILLQEVNTLKSHFNVIETAIDTASETSPTVESIENLINQL